MAIKVVVFHEFSPIADGLTETLNNMGFEAISLSRFDKLAKQEAEKPIDCDVGIIHKDFTAAGLIAGKAVLYTAQRIIEKIIPESARRVIVAGEYPHAKNRVINDFRADRYWDIMATEFGGFFDCIRQGRISPQEAELRGISVLFERGSRVTADPEIISTENTGHSRDDYFRRERGKEKDE